MVKERIRNFSHWQVAGLIGKMNKGIVFYIRRLCWFLVPFLSIGLLADMGWKNRTDYFYIRWKSLYEPIEAEVLIVGNSRACVHIDPLIVDSMLNRNCYNLGITGGPYEFSEVAWRLYKAHNRSRPKLVVCNVDYMFLDNSRRKFSRQEFIPFLKDTCFSLITDQPDFLQMDIHIPLLRYASNKEVLIKNLAACFDRNPKPDPNFIKGSYLTRGSGYEQLNVTRTKAHFRIGEKRVGLFSAFLDECSVNGTTVVFMKSPLRPEIYSLVTGLDDCFALIDSIAFSRKLPVLDYTDYLTEDSLLFSDPIHLNDKGATMLSKRLCNDLKALGVLEE